VNPTSAEQHACCSPPTLAGISIVNKTYVYALEDIVLGDVADKLDFMWIDWQQGGKMGGAAGGKQNPTIWTNKVILGSARHPGSYLFLRPVLKQQSSRTTFFSRHALLMLTP